MSDHGHQRETRRGYQNWQSTRRQHQQSPAKKSVIIKSIDIESDLFKSIFQVGDNTTTAKDEILDLAKLLIRDFKQHSAPITKILKICISETPWKTGIYAVLFATLNHLEPKHGSALMDIVGDAMDEAVQANNWRIVRLVMRFYADLFNANMLDDFSLYALLDIFLNAAIAPAVAEERADCFMYIVLSTIFWSSRKMNEKDGVNQGRILALCEGYMSQRTSPERAASRAKSLQAIMHVRGGDSRMTDMLESLWNLILELPNKNWQISALPTPFASFELENQVQLKSRSFTLPYDEQSIKYPFQGFRVRINTQPITIERFLLEDLSTDIIKLFAHNHPRAAKYLLALSDYIITDVNLHDVIIETCFSELFRLPRSTERAVYYTALIADLCKAALDKVPPALGRAIRGIYGMFDLETADGIVAGGTDVEIVQRFGEWFALHLSNFAFNWKWADWDAVLGKDDTSAQMVFVREALERCVRLAYYDRIKATLPPSFKEVPTVFWGSAPRPNFKYEQPVPNDPMLNELINDLKVKMTAKASAEEILRILERIRAHVSERKSGVPDIKLDGGMDVDAEINPDDIAREAFMQCLLQIGHKSFSHSLTAIERYLQVLKSLTAFSAAKFHTVQIVADYWYYKPEMMEILLDKLGNYGIIDSPSLISWVLSPETLEEGCTRWYLQTILITALSKLRLKVTQTRSKLYTAEEDFRLRQEVLLREGIMQDEDEGGSLEQLRAVVNASEKEQREAYMNLFQKFKDSIYSKIQIDTANGIDDTANTYWWRWVSGIFRRVVREFEPEVKSMLFTMDTLVFTDDTHETILQLWNEQKAMLNRRFGY